MAARIAAVVVAAGLIVGGLLIRRGIDDDDSDAEPSNPGDSTTAPETATVITCITELEAACESLAGDQFDVTIEPAGDTLDKLASLDNPNDAPLWITIDPFAAMADALRVEPGDEPVGYETSPVAASQIGVVVPSDGRWPALIDRCNFSSAWRCIGDWAGDRWSDHGGDAQWSTVRPAIGDPEASALGLAAFADAVSGYSGSPEIDTTALTADVKFTGWLDDLADTVKPLNLTAGTPLATMLVLPTRIDLAAAPEAEFLHSNAPTITDFEIQYPEPSMWATAVLAVPASKTAPDGLADQLGTALRDAGWSPASEGASAPLPDASTMLALRNLWSQ